MRILFLVCILSFMLVGCRESDTSVQGDVGYGASSENNFSQIASNVTSSKGYLSYRQTIGAKLPSTPPSQMALDRSQFGDRRIAESHSLNIDIQPEGLKARYDRDFKKCLELGCEITQSNVKSRYSAVITASIAPDQLPAYLDFIGTGDGDLKSHSVSADDKTLQYIDTDAKIKNLEALHLRLLALLESPKADNIKDILEIERELNRVNQQLDSAKGSLRHLAKITGKASVQIYYNVPYRDIEVRYYDLQNSFKLAWQSFVNNLSGVIQFIGGVLPWIPVWVLGFWFVVKTIGFVFGTRKSLNPFRKTKTVEAVAVETKKSKSPPKTKAKT